MVELRVESVNDKNMPSDTFVSVRIGETQKLSRLASSRVYRFPQVGDRHYGKIEVYQRIGSCNIDINPQNEGTRDVSINCLDYGFGTLGLKVDVEADQKTKEKEPEGGTGKKVGTKVKAAKDYLNKHGLEVRLSEAMQAVLRERPDDPVGFLAAKLTETNGSSGVKLPPLANSQKEGAPMPESKAPPAPDSPPNLPPSPAKPRALEPLQKSTPPEQKSAPPEQKSAPPVKQEAPEPKTEAIVPFAPYYNKAFLDMPQSAFAQLYNRFPPATKSTGATAAKKPEVLAIVPFTGYYNQNFPCAQTDAFAKLHSKFPKKTADSNAVVQKAASGAVLPFGTYYRENFAATPRGALTDLYSKFPTNAPAAKAAPAVVAVLPFGTYYRENFTATPRGALTDLYSKFESKVPAKVAEAKAVPAIADFRTLPSVGTWLAPRAPKAPVTKTLTSPDAKEPFQMKPSVGTWLIHRPLESEEEAEETVTNWCHKPSIGTWLQPLVEEDEPATEQADENKDEWKRPEIQMTSAMMCGPAFATLNLPMHLPIFI